MIHFCWRSGRRSTFSCALRRLAADAGPAFERSEELAYLANVLTAAGTIEGRRMRPIEAVREAMAVCERGLEAALARAKPRSRDRVAEAARVLARTPCDVLFRVGWKRGDSR
jgi:hypothetical protein